MTRIFDLHYCIMSGLFKTILSGKSTNNILTYMLRVAVFCTFPFCLSVFYPWIFTPVFWSDSLPPPPPPPPHGILRLKYLYN